MVWLNHKAAFMHIRAMDRDLHWVNLGVLFTTALLPFPTTVISETMRKSHPTDERTAVGLSALVGVLLCLSWLVFYYYLSRHPELLDHEIKWSFFAHESIRAWVGLISYAMAGMLGWLVAPWIALAIFLALPVFFGITSHGLRKPHAVED